MTFSEFQRPPGDQFAKCLFFPKASPKWDRSLRNSLVSLKFSTFFYGPMACRKISRACAYRRPFSESPWRPETCEKRKASTKLNSIHGVSIRTTFHHHSLDEGLLCCFHSLAIVNRAAMNVAEQIPVEKDGEPSGHMPRTALGPQLMQTRANPVHAVSSYVSLMQSAFKYLEHKSVGVKALGKHQLNFCVLNELHKLSAAKGPYHQFVNNHQ
ncbi:hypothetical protein STEG23_007132 [Scotinomys teguina]